MERLNITSESEQMYLVTIAHLGEIVDECPIPIAKVAEILEVTPISANQMIHNLEALDLITYTPYKGVEFTETGWQTARKILRNRRLWEVFLVDHLRYAPREAETLACALEHAISEETADRLAEFLNWPQVSPRGKEIPQDEAEPYRPKGVPLHGLAAGVACRVGTIQAGKAEQDFLRQAGLVVGVAFKILGSQQNGACLIESEETGLLSLAPELAAQILVETEL